MKKKLKIIIIILIIATLAATSGTYFAISENNKKTEAEQQQKEQPEKENQQKIAKEKKKAEEAKKKKEAETPEEITHEKLLQAINDERAKHGVQPLIMDDRLNASAQEKADDMKTGNYFNHMNPKTGKQGYQYIINRTGDSCYNASENLIQRSHNSKTIKSMIDGWMSSDKGHREAILDPENRYTGFGITYNINWKNSAVVVEHFCKPRY